jgi:methane monooxygenase component A beta chain/propane monooxygenase small subunit
MNPEWVREVLGRYYAAWPFVEYGLFLSLCYAVREALGDSVMFALVFEAADKVRAGEVLQLAEQVREHCPAALLDRCHSDRLLAS